MLGANAVALFEVYCVFDNIITFFPALSWQFYLNFPLPFSLRYIIRGDDEEWNEVLSKAGQNASIVSVKRLGKLKYSTVVSLVLLALLHFFPRKGEAEELIQIKMNVMSLIYSQFSREIRV